MAHYNMVVMSSMKPNGKKFAILIEKTKLYLQAIRVGLLIQKHIKIQVGSSLSSLNINYN